MAESIEFYLARAEACALEAKNSALDNVRERALRAEAAWRTMADRLALVRTQRAIADQEREDRREAEQAAAGVIPAS